MELTLTHAPAPAVIMVLTAYFDFVSRMGESVFKLHQSSIVGIVAFWTTVRRAQAGILTNPYIGHATASFPQQFGNGGPLARIGMARNSITPAGCSASPRSSPSLPLGGSRMAQRESLACQLARDGWPTPRVPPEEGEPLINALRMRPRPPAVSFQRLARKRSGPAPEGRPPFAAGTRMACLTFLLSLGHIGITHRHDQWRR